MNDKSFVGKPLPLQTGGQVYIKPGTGPVEEATEANAIENIRAFVDDLTHDENDRPNGRDICWTRDGARDYGDGRYAFMLSPETFTGQPQCEIQMPGLPLDQVQWTPSKNPWHFPRLYVDGSSWLWDFALESARSALFESEDES